MERRIFMKYSMLTMTTLILPNIAFAQDVTHVKRYANPFSEEEVFSLIEKAEGQFKLILIFQFFTGARPNEMINLKWKDIDFKNKTINISTRKIDMPTIVATALRNQYVETGSKSKFVFLDTSEKVATPYIGVDKLRKKQWTNLLKEVGLKYRKFSITRHTFAITSLNNGEKPEWVGVKMLGHSSSRITNKYYQKYKINRDRLL